MRTTTSAGRDDPALIDIHESGSPLLEWVVRFGHVVLVCAAAFSVVAVPLAMAGWFRWYLLFPAVAVLAAGLFVADPRAPFRLRAGTAPTVAVLVLVGVATMLSLLHPTQHFATNRDPGIYSVTGLWLEREGTILFDALPQEMRHGQVQSTGAGFYAIRDDGRLQPQFAHLTHTLLGAAAMVGDEALLTRANVVVGGAGMILLYLLIQQVAAGWAAAATTSALAFALPQLYFTRGPYSEPLAQLLILGGLAILVSGPAWSRGHALLAGLLLGAVMGSRVDAVLLLAALVLVIVAWLLSTTDTPRSPLAFLVGGVALTGGIGIVDLRFYATGYFNDLWPEFRSALLLAVAAALVGAVVVVGRRWVERVARTLTPHRARIATATVGAAWLALLFVLFVRTHFPVPGRREVGLISGLQARQGLEVTPRTYAEQSAEWMAWYLGWPLALVAAVGACVVLHRLITRWSWPLFTSVAVLALPTAVYLYRPSIAADHLWVMRRFLPAAMPLFALLAAIGLTWMVAVIAAGGSQKMTRGAMLGLSALIVVPAMSTSLPYWTFREFRLDTAALREACDIIDGRPALVDSANLTGHQLVHTLAAACGVDAARLNVEGLGTVQTVARRYAESDVDVVLVSSQDGLEAHHPEFEPQTNLTYRANEIERSVNRPPMGAEPRTGTPTLYFYTVVP